MTSRPQRRLQAGLWQETHTEGPVGLSRILCRGCGFRNSIRCLKWETCDSGTMLYCDCCMYLGVSLKLGPGPPSRMWDSAAAAACNRIPGVSVRYQKHLSCQRAGSSSQRQSKSYSTPHGLSLNLQPDRRLSLNPRPDRRLSLNLKPDRRLRRLSLNPGPPSHSFTSWAHGAPETFLRSHGSMLCRMGASCRVPFSRRFQKHTDSFWWHTPVLNGAAQR